MYQVISTTQQSFFASPSGRRRLVWFTGTKDECESTLPRIQSYFHNTSDEFSIIKVEDK